MLRIAICDDEISQINTIKGYIDELSKIYPGIEYDVYHSGDELLKYYKRMKMDEFYDIIFLDIEMEGTNGLLTAHKLRYIDNNALIIYITHFSKYVFKSFDTAPFRYLLKPVPQKKFEKVFKEAYNTIKAKSNTFCFTANYKKIRVFTDKIIYFESELRKIILHTTEDTYEFYGKLKDIYKELNQNSFVMVHSSYIINMNYILEVEYAKVLLQNRISIPVSPARSQEVQEAFANFEFRRCDL